MTDILTILLKITVVIFMAGNLLDLGLRLNLKEALRGLRDVRFVTLSVLWAFVLCPALAYGLTLVIPLTPAYAMGLILLGLAPCAPLLPTMADKARGDLIDIGFIGSIGTYAIGTQILYFSVITAASYALGFGMPGGQKSVLSLGICTRNCGAAMAPLFVAPDVDQSAIVMVTLGIPYDGGFRLDCGAPVCRPGRPTCQFLRQPGRA